MHCVMVTSKSFGYGAEADQLHALFEKYQFEPVFTSLEKPVAPFPRRRVPS